MKNLLIATVLAFAGCNGTGCAAERAVVTDVKQDVGQLAHCSAADVSAILAATGVIVTNVTALANHSGDAGSGAMAIFAALGQLHSAWAHCAAPSAPPAATVPVAPAISAPHAEVRPVWRRFGAGYVRSWV